MQKERQNLKAI